MAKEKKDTNHLKTNKIHIIICLCSQTYVSMTPEKGSITNTNWVPEAICEVQHREVNVCFDGSGTICSVFSLHATFGERKRKYMGSYR